MRGMEDKETCSECGAYVDEGCGCSRSEHDNLKLVGTMNYCRGGLTKGCKHKEECDCKPIVVTDMISGTYKDTTEWIKDLWDKDEYGNLVPVRLQCIFMNSKGRAKASGAKAVLEEYR